MRKITPPTRKLISNNTGNILGEFVAADYATKVAMNLLTKTSHSIEDIAALAEVPVDFVMEVKKRLKTKNK